MGCLVKASSAVIGLEATKLEQQTTDPRANLGFLVCKLAGSVVKRYTRAIQGHICKMILNYISCFDQLVEHLSEIVMPRSSLKVGNGW